MELLEIRSSHDLTANVPAARPAGPHSYTVHCRQFVAVRREWERGHPASAEALDVMTLTFERIWITEQEIKRVAAAIEATDPSVVLD